MSSSKEKRKISRVSYDYSCNLLKGEESCICHIRNFSLTGLLVEADSTGFCEAGDSVTIYLDHFSPEISKSEIVCEIAWIKDRMIGLQFSAIDYDTLMQFKDTLYELIEDKNRIEDEIVNLIKSH